MKGHNYLNMQACIFGSMSVCPFALFCTECQGLYIKIKS